MTTDVANAISDFGMQKVEEQLTVKFMVQDTCWMMFFGVLEEISVGGIKF